MQTVDSESSSLISQHPDYAAWVAGQRLYRRRMAVVLGGSYAVFLLSVVFLSCILLTPVSVSNPTPWLVPFAAFFILLQFLLTGIYVKHANTVGDEERERMRSECLRFNNANNSAAVKS